MFKDYARHPTAVKAFIERVQKASKRHWCADGRSVFRRRFDPESKLALIDPSAI
jgi:hypothetical protein